MSSGASYWAGLYYFSHFMKCNADLEKQSNVEKDNGHLLREIAAAFGNGLINKRCHIKSNISEMCKHFDTHSEWEYH